MRYKFTVFLLVLNVLAFGLIVFLGQRAEQTGPQPGGLSEVIGREVTEADRIELRGERLDSARILERNGSTWALTEPMQWSANYYAVNRILNQLQFLEEEASFSIEEMEQTGQTLEEYGLADPFLTLTIAHANESLVLDIGKPTDIGNNVYLLGPGKRDVYVVDRQVVDSLLVGLADLRTREIFDIPVFEVQALSLQIKAPEAVGSGDLKVRLARSGRGWVFEAPLAAEADTALVANAINSLTAAKVVEFREESSPDLKALGLENPFMQVTLHGNKRRQTLLLGNKNEATEKRPATYYARLEDNPTVFTVAAKPFDVLRESQEALRERNFMTFEREALTAINISEDSLQIRLQKLETDGWQVIKSSAGDDIQPFRADPDIIQTLIRDLKNLRASGFAVDAPTPADLERLGFNAPRRTVTLSLTGTDDLTLRLAHPDGDNDNLYARSDKAEYIYQVERRPTLRMLPLNALYYRNRTLDTLPEAARIHALKLENLETGEVHFDQTLGSADARWENVLSELPAPEQDAWLSVVQAVRKFTVDRYLADHFDSAYVLDETRTLPWKYRLTAGIVLPGGDTVRRDTRSYVFTERLSGTVQVGGSQAQGTIFEIQQDLFDALDVLTEPSALPPEASDAPVPEPTPVEPVSEPVPTADALPED